MTDAAPTHIYGDNPDYELAAGMFAMAMIERPARKFKTIDGDRRRFGDRTPGAATLMAIQGDKR